MYLRFSSFLIACIIVLGFLALALPVRPHDTGFEDSIFNDVTVRVHQAEGGGLAPVQILRGGDVLLTLDLANPRVDPFDDGLIDVTGDGALNLVVLDQPADGACCYEYHFIDFSDGAGLLTTVDTGIGAAVAFWNRDHGPDLELTLRDWHFVGWRAPEQESPTPTVYLKFDPETKSFLPNGDLMRDRPGSNEYLGAQAGRVSSHPLWGARDNNPWFADLWEIMLREIYEGNLPQACIFYAIAWPPDFPGAETFLVEFEGHLRSGPYWSEISAMNGNPLEGLLCGDPATALVAGQGEITIERRNLEKTILTVGETTAELFVWENSIWSYLLVRRDGEVLLSQEMEKAYLKSDPSGAIDMTGNGLPNVVVRDHTGGQCCYSYWMLEIGENPRIIDQLDGGEGGVDFVNLDDEPDLEVRGYLYGPFKYWHAPGAGSVGVPVINKFDVEADTWIPNIALMREPPMAERGLVAKSIDIRINSIWSTDLPTWNSDLWGTMLGLIFSSNKDQACKLEALAWPPEIPDEAAFRAHFNRDIRTHPVWEYLVQSTDADWDAPLCGWEIDPEAANKFSSYWGDRF